MRTLSILAVSVAMATTAAAAPNVTNVTQKGSLLVFPDIRIDAQFSTLVRIQNDGSLDVDLLCYWMDGNKNRVDFVIPVTRNQAVWFDAQTGQGTYQVNPFPQSLANGFDNPFLLGPPLTTDEAADTAGPYLAGLLACWAVDGGAQNQVKWNHLSGTATVYNPTIGAYEYNAYAFFVPTGLDQEPVGVAGNLNLNGVEYDSCPLYQIGQFSPFIQPPAPGRPGVQFTILTIAGCTLDLRQDWVPIFTKLQFDLWNEDEVKFTGAYDCADSWHELLLRPGGGFFGGAQTFITASDAAEQNFDPGTLGSYAARYRVQGVKSTQCESTSPPRVTQAVGVLGVQMTTLALPTPTVGTTLAGAGKINGRITWDPEGAVPEGGVRD